DLHDAVSFDLRAQAAARLHEDPQCVDRFVDHWNLPHATPLHHAARLNREALATLLLDRGAQPSLLAGDGRTALDLADESGAVEIARQIQAHGGVRAADL